MNRPSIQPPAFPARNYEFSEYVSVDNWVGGVWRKGSGDGLPIINPRHGKPMGEVRLSTTSDVADAVEAAKAGFQVWRCTPIKERVQVLYRLKHLMERDAEELSWLVSHENGKD